MHDETFIKKLRQTLCGKIISRELNSFTNIVQMYIFIQDINVSGGKINLEGVRIAGWVLWHTGVKQELADISYKISLDKDGLHSLTIYNSLWQILGSRLKHFEIPKADVSIKGKMTFLKVKRFMHHVKAYMPLDSEKK